MTASTFQMLYSREQIRQSWEGLWKESKRQRAPGVDGITPGNFRANEARYLTTLVRDIRAKSYFFRGLRPFLVPKSNGDTRIIAVPTVQDRIVQRVLCEYITSKSAQIGILNDVSFGFLRSVEGKPKGVIAARDRAITLRNASGWVYKTDIASFFDCIKRERILKETISALNSPSLYPILKAAISCEIETNDKGLRRIIQSKGITTGRGLRQGMPLSPLLSNILLRKFDQKLLRKSYKMVRYADDIIVFADSKAQCISIDRTIRSALSKLDLTTPTIDAETKTQIAEPGEPIDFLGMSLAPSSQKDGYSLVLTDRQLGKIKNSIADAANKDKMIKDKRTIDSLGRYLLNMTGGYRAAFSAAENKDALEEIIADAPRRLVRKVFVDAFGEPAMSQLGREYQMIFGFRDFP